MIKTVLCDLGGVIVFVNYNKIIEGLAKYSDKTESHIYRFFSNSIARKDFDKGKINTNRLFMNFKKF